jgi:hypothetical protein
VLFATALQVSDEMSSSRISVRWLPASRTLATINSQKCCVLGNCEKSKSTTLPFLIRGIPRRRDWEKTETGDSKLPVNLPTQFLQLIANPKKDIFGFYRVGLGTQNMALVIVVREDKKSLTPHQLESLAYYCGYEINLAIEEEAVRSDGLGIEKVAENIIKHWMCRDRFDEFFYTFKHKKIERGDKTWDDEISPYEVGLSWEVRELRRGKML